MTCLCSLLCWHLMTALCSQDTSLNMLFAGHDTSASAIILAMRHLKLQPHILQRLREEQQEVTRNTSPLYEEASLV